MTRERNNHDWNREDNRNQNRRDDRYSRDRKNKRSFSDRREYKDNDKFSDKREKFSGRRDKFSNRRDRFSDREERFAEDRTESSYNNRHSNRNERRFNRDDKTRRFDKKNQEHTPRRRRAFEEYKMENESSRRPRIKRNDKGERIFTERRTSSTPNQLQPKSDNKAVRLNKYIANAGICSRREADVLIATGVIQVNGEVITTLGYKVQPGDIVKYNGRTLKNEKKIYILLNKPKGYITTSDDPQQRKTVMELISGACSERVYPVGRLDRMTTGLLLLTNDGEMTKKLTHPSFGAQKVYNAELDHPLTKEDMTKLLNGVELEDGEMKVDDVNWLNTTPLDKKKIGVSIHSGKNRIIRRLFEALGYEVKKLDRVYFAGLTKKNLLRGQYRFLDDKEIGFLHMQQ